MGLCDSHGTGQSARVGADPAARLRFQIELCLYDRVGHEWRGNLELRL
jgi:hypothetical protein